jgi:succinate dehydrogenase / fumarate reductase cytochrome b subunit
MCIKQTWLSSIGQKLLLATTGLVMFFFFLVPHLCGNILFLFGPGIFNSYAEHLHQLVPLVVGIEVLMLASVSVHMAMAVRVVWGNHMARDRRVTLRSSEERSWAARLMPVSGIMILVFIVKHLLDFTLRAKPQASLSGHMVNDVYGMMLDKFSHPGQVVFYLLFMVAVGLHLSHALQSALQTFGWYVPRTGSRIKLASALVAVLMASTFAIMPVVAFFR